MNNEKLKKQRKKEKEHIEWLIKTKENLIEFIKKEKACRQLEMEMYSRYIDEGDFRKTFRETAIENQNLYPEYNRYTEIVNHIGTYNGIENSRVAQIKAVAKLVETEENLKQLKEKYNALNKRRKNI